MYKAPVFTCEQSRQLWWRTCCSSNNELTHLCHRWTLPHLTSSSSKVQSLCPSCSHPLSGTAIREQLWGCNKHRAHRNKLVKTCANLHVLWKHVLFTTNTRYSQPTGFNPKLIIYWCQQQWMWVDQYKQYTQSSVRIEFSHNLWGYRRERRKWTYPLIPGDHSVLLVSASRMPE